MKRKLRVIFDMLRPDSYLVILPPSCPPRKFQLGDTKQFSGTLPGITVTVISVTCPLS